MVRLHPGPLVIPIGRTSSMSELIRKVGGLLKGTRRDRLDVYLEKSSRRRERELMKERKAIAAFEKKLSGPALRKSIDDLVKSHSLQECERGVGGSALVYGDNNLRLIFRPTGSEFRRIVADMKPASIRYKGLNEDDDGVWGVAFIEIGKEIAIESNEYLFGYSGLDSLCKQLGYKDERKYTGHFGRDTTGHFSL